MYLSSVHSIVIHVTFLQAKECWNEGCNSCMKGTAIYLLPLRKFLFELIHFQTFHSICSLKSYELIKFLLRQRSSNEIYSTLYVVLIVAALVWLCSVIHY